MKYKQTLSYAALAIVFIILVYFTPSLNAYDVKRTAQAPEFTHSDPQAWINSSPLTLAGLRGRVVMLDFWTFDCWNCYRSFPWLKALEAKFADRELTVVGVHTPEFKHERVRVNVVRKVEEFALEHPVMMDNDYSYWRAMGNRYWPAFYLIDKQGHVRAVYVGETHAGDRQAESIEHHIAELLSEPAS
ncbi:MAG: redoxin family protein [Acidiferrobacterales bacterium]